ncbi:hypothetical protein P9027_02030 [Bacillus thuringiensis]|uniref:DUF2971 domain-containing protein n=1 Tax=Bacillus thuringiensis HD-771 TaxID=1218175 RepID=A0A9W3NXY8_BACTU|nr:hypothetical protein [Bacillus thuringiensis]AFQ16480.1 hypothetical protein BTG_15150 [Bacillus thuringiensis HD-771]AND06269.1 hypothetical protein Bt4C1_03370 [Bacillus thuringiensis serovar alesti]AND06631.1 hypothetical protein Bt4C1_05380 [Bacillus thuringiensis serovar alesti]AND10498.1 hypothetical protein Bt4C1_25910 [Bacillus thuringiensis serovar alesti]MEC2472493.1 hypothetical protein [Bacillus thuringiensis]
MFKQNLCFNTPRDDTKIWRYMDFTKFVSMLELESLFFVRSDKFRDPFEGVFPKITDEILAQKYMGIRHPTKGYDVAEMHKRIFAKSRKFMTINCWHINEGESAAMWDLYLSSFEGVAIQSTVSSLKRSLENTEESICIGSVNYLDYQTDVIPIDNIYWPYICKRKSFAHEKELRAVHDTGFLNKFGTIDQEESPVKIGLPIKCDIHSLIENIYVSPNSPRWFEELVRSVCKKYGLDKEVFKSNLYEITY